MASKKYTSQREELHTKLNSSFEIPKGKRRVKHYQVFEGELSSLAAAGAMASVFFAIASATVAFIGGIAWDFAMIPDPTDYQVKVKESFLAVLWVAFGVSAAVSAWMGIWTGCRIHRIKKEHRFENL